MLQACHAGEAEPGTVEAKSTIDSVTGEFNPATEQVLLPIPVARDLPRTGYLDHETIRSLGLDPQDL